MHSGRFVLVRLCGGVVSLPAGVTILEAFDRTGSRATVVGNYCRAGECAHCAISWRDTSGRVRDALACIARVVEGMEIVGVSRHLVKDLGRSV